MTYEERKKKLLQLAKKKRVLNPNESWIDPGSRSAHRVSLFADRLRREGLITHNPWIFRATFDRTVKASSRGSRQDGESDLEVRSTSKIRLSSLWFYFLRAVLARPVPNPKFHHRACPVFGDVRR